MVKKMSNSRDEFMKKVKIIDKRNIMLNDKLIQVQETFESKHEAHKLLLECELKEIEMLKESILSQHK